MESCISGRLAATMTRDEFLKLQPGDIVRHVLGESSFIVTVNYGTHVTAVRTADLTNPEEWLLIQKAKTATGPHIHIDQAKG
jgi:hypothetical protein